MRTDEALARKWFAKHGMTELVNDVVSRCPTKTIMLKETKDLCTGPKISSVALNDTQSLEIDNANCVRCMHCINVMTGALATGTDKGVTILIEPKAVLFLLGSEIDYEAGDLAAKFVFRNPNETDACGCGESVTITPATSADA